MNIYDKLIVNNIITNSKNIAKNSKAIRELNKKSWVSLLGWSVTSILIAINIDTLFDRVYALEDVVLNTEAKNVEDESNN